MLQVLTRRHQLHLKETLENEMKDKAKLREQGLGKGEGKSKTSDLIKPMPDAKATAKAAACKTKAKAKAATTRGRKRVAPPTTPLATNDPSDEEHPDRDVEAEMEAVASERSREAARVDDGGEKVETPRKKLFDDDGNDEEPKPAGRGRGRKPGKAKAKAEPKNAAKARAKAKAKSERAPNHEADGGDASDPPKRKRQRRSTVQIPEETLSLEDPQMQKTISADFEKLEGWEFSDLKNFLITDQKLKLNNVTIMPYWSRCAVGLKWHLLPGNSQIAYFAYKESPRTPVGHMQGAWNKRMVAAFVSAQLFVPGTVLKSYLCFFDIGS